MSQGQLNLKGTHHDHIDGSRAVADVILDLYRLAGKEFPFPSADAWLEFFRNPQENIVARFATITGVMQSRETLETVAYAYGRRRANEGLAYAEGKFAPQYHTAGGLTLAEVADAVQTGLKRAEKVFRIRLLPVLGIGRETGVATGIAIARLALEYDGEMALDLVCDEANHPPEKHLPAYQLTFGSKVRRDCHAGEWVAPEPQATYRARLLQNVRTAVYDLRCHGIGHGIPLADDSELVAYMAAEGIRLAACPLSNRYCGVLNDIRDLRLDELLDRGLIVTVNPDDDLFMPTLAETADACQTAYAFTPSQRATLEDNVFRGAFAPDAAKYLAEQAESGTVT